MLPICRSSTRITSNRRAMPVLVFSAQSLRRSVSRARSRAIACLHPAAAVRAALRAGQLALQPPQPGPLPRGQGGSVQHLAGGQGRGDRHPPVNAHRPGRYPGAGPARGSRRRRHASGPRGPSSPGRTSRPAARRGTSGTAPIRPWAPRPGRPSGTPGAHPTAAPRPTIRNPSSRPALRHDGRPAGLPGSKNAVIARAKSRSACCWTVWEPAASHGCSARAGGELPALLQVARRALPARPPVGVLLDGQVPYVPGVAAVVPQHGLLGGRGEQPVPGHANTLANTIDISGEVTRRFLPGLKTGVSTPRF